MLNLTPITVPTFARVTDYAGLWAIEPTRGAMLWQWAQRENLPAHIASATPPKLKSEVQQTKGANGQTVAIVMLAGPLMKAQSSMSAGTSTVQARREIRQAANDPNVSAILLAIDSPGGTVSGTADLASEVRAAAKRKPVWAQVEDLGASAAYWIASQADKVFANDATALVGSVGTLMTVYDTSVAADKLGVKALVFATGPLKGAGADGAPVSDEQQAYFQRLVNDAQISFDAAVKRGRGMTDTQLAKVSTGGVFSASEAISLKLLDGIQSLDATVNALAIEAKRVQRQANQQRAESPLSQGVLKMDETNSTPVVADVQATIDAQIKMAREAYAAEAERVAKINAACATQPMLAAQAIKEGWTPERAELAALKASLTAQPQGGGIITGASKWQRGQQNAAPNVPLNAALEVAVRMSLGRNVEKEYKPEILEAAHDNFRHIGMQQLFMLCAQQNGYAAAPGERIHAGNLREILRHATANQYDRNATASTVSLSGILGAVANKEILAGYVEEDATWKNIAEIKPVTNFQQFTSYRMLDDMEYEELGPDGKIKHGTAAQESYTRQAKTYAKMFALTRQQIINDDLGAFNDIRTRLGRGSSKKFNKVFWTAFINNSSFFTTARTNYIEGSTTNLGTDGVGLSLGVKAFRTMKSPVGSTVGSGDGQKRINASTQMGGSNPGGRPSVLLVPPDLEANAEILFRNTNLGAVSGATANIHANKYRPVVAWQLGDSAYTGYSATAWYLFNDPSYLAPMVVSFLNGMIAPTVESADADFDELGIQFRGYHDFGCDQAEYLAGTKSKGAA